MSKILKLIQSQIESDQMVAKAVIRRKPKLRRDLIAVGKYVWPRDYDKVTRSFKSLGAGNFQSFLYHSLFDEDLQLTCRIVRSYYDLQPQGLYYKKALEALKRIKKDQY